MDQGLKPVPGMKHVSQWEWWEGGNDLEAGMQLLVKNFLNLHAQKN
jgi:hypothetical protein